MTRKNNDTSRLDRRSFLTRTGGAIVGVAAGGRGVLGDVDRPAQGHSGGSSGGGSRGWQVAPGHYEGHFPLHLIYPRPDGETESYARHRHAYPGVRYEIPIGVQFGKWPYRYELIEGPQGAAMVHQTLQWNGIDAFEVPEGYGVVAWDVPADAPAGPHRFTVRVYDQDHGRPEPSFVDVHWTTTVGTDQFIFLDPINGDDATADGSIKAPYREISALYDSGRAGNKICYIRQTPLFDPDDSQFAGGYTPTPARQFVFGDDAQPKAYVAFPGETVHVNTVNQTGFAQSTRANNDVFFDGITVGFTNQARKNQENVRVIIHWQRSRRSTFWRMGCIRAFGGTVKNDNHGFIWYMNAGGSVDEMTGHSYLYAADCWMDRMNIDPGANAAFDGVGSNGAHLWETYACNRTLAERLTITNSRIVNNGFVINKGAARDGEIRACVSVDGNSGDLHVRCQGFSGTARMAMCYNRTGNHSNEGRVSMGQAGANPPYRDIVSYRNSCAGRISGATNENAISHAYNNVAAGISDTVKRSDGNIVHGGNIASVFDHQMRLVGAARRDHLGTRGAETA
jgi:hypothetical protein